MMMADRLAALDGTDYDVVVIGGGAAGASATQNLAARGFRTLLVDQGDFASGTSSRSSRLLYCGLSYLSPDYPLWRAVFHPREMWQRLRMVRLAMRCRDELARTSPERVTPFEFIFPVKRQSDYPRWKVALGYRVLGLFASAGIPLAYRHEAMPKAAQSGLAAFMEPAGLAGVARFREYQYNWAERICMDAVMDAERLGARVENYTRVTGFRREGADWCLSLGAGTYAGHPQPASNRTAEVRAKFLVNTAGAWVDRLLAQGPGRHPRHVIGEKGINLLVKLPDSCRGLGMETISSRKQPFYLMPWGDYHFFGPTQTVFEGPPEDVRVLPEEMDYVLAEANRIFPSFRLTRDDVLYSWAGVRPRTSDSSAEVMRVFTLHDLGREGLDNAIAVTGVPIMIHRHAGREIAAWIGARLTPTGQPGQLDPGARLLPVDDGPAIGGVPVTSLRAAARDEHVHCLADLMFRRVNMGWQVDMGLPYARAVAEAVSDILGWNADRIAAEVAAYDDFVNTIFSPRSARGDLAAEPMTTPPDQDIKAARYAVTALS